MEQEEQEGRMLEVLHIKVEPASCMLAGPVPKRTGLGIGVVCDPKMGITTLARPLDRGSGQRNL